MDINTKEGDKIIFIGASAEQINFGNCDDPNNELIVGERYTVDRTEVHQWHTNVFVKEATGAFPSVAFSSDVSL